MNICTHYGFGDFVICYGLVRELAKKDNILLFITPHCSPLHVDNVKRLYSSLPNVTITTDNPKDYKDVLYIGWDKFFAAVQQNPLIQNQRFFYDQAGVPFNLLWDNFYFERNLNKEKEIYYSLGLKDGEEYLFLHDDPIRGFVIKSKYLRDIKTIHLIEHQNISILDTLYLVENAKEVHVTNTGLVPFIDLMKIKHENLNYHKYVRPLPFEQPILTMKWNIIYE